ncbi:MarR family winged helix-turn-helix transcriptional regulator [Emcibacter sp.]|uniref:MarR family winged helix-turn-helix transcriptional regulator n=1 Tax=Emcibacter sp. TaxID=1979954 RepID=UPI002AA7ED68|nr:MarR family transcriptional regulator [Emcibacter sp.]
MSKIQKKKKEDIEQGPEHTLHRLLKLHNRLIVPFSVHVERQFSITINQFRLLMLIGRLGTTASHELAEMTGVNSMSVSRAISELKKQGRITVDSDPSNRRRKTLALTEEGQKLYEALLPSTEKVMKYLFAALKPDEVMAFDRYVETLIDALEATDENGQSRFLEYTRL